MIVGTLTSRLLENIAFVESIVLIKQAPGSFIDGHYVTGTITQFPIKAEVQPIDSKTRMDFVGAERNIDIRIVFVATSDFDFISPIRQGSSATQADQIVFNGLDFYVHSIDDFSHKKHVEIIMVRIEGQND